MLILCPEGKTLRLAWYQVCVQLEPQTFTDSGIAGMRLRGAVLAKISLEKRNNAARQYQYALYVEHVKSCQACYWEGDENGYQEDDREDPGRIQAGGEGDSPAVQQTHGQELPAHETVCG